MFSIRVLRFAGDKLHKKAGSRGQHITVDDDSQAALLHNNQNQGRSGGRSSMAVPKTRSDSVTVHQPLNRRFQPIASDI